MSYMKATVTPDRYEPNDTVDDSVLYRTGPRILAIDIETAPHTAHVWSLWQQNVGLSQLMETGRVLCFAWKWLGEKGTTGFASEKVYDRKTLLKIAHELLEAADIVVTYNGKKFDVPTLNKEFLEGGMPPPAPYKHVDLYRTAKSRFRFASNKMDHLAHQLGIKAKIRHSGHELWVRCMAGDEDAWLKMERYNKRDVYILDKLYYKMLPWIGGHPNVALFNHAGKARVCPSCGSNKVQSRGIYVTSVRRYGRLHCQACGTWSRTRLVSPSEQTPQLVQAV
jgi:DNA polymerase elongation subunit (family B)